MKEIEKRSLTGVVYIFLMLAGAAIHPLIFVVVFGAFLYLTQFEFYKLVETAGNSPRKTTGLTLGLLLFLISFGMVNNIIPTRFYLIFILALMVIFLFEAFSKRRGILQNSAVTLTGFVYVAIPFSLLNFMVYPGYPYSPEFNAKILIGVFFIVWMYDSMAYLFGSKFGKHKIHKTISPNKSWEGLIGGAVFALAMGVVNALIFGQLSMLNWILVALLSVISGTLGDLFESIIKRRLKVKDSGTILPGHGGLLDRFDSLLFVIPVVYVWLNLSGNLL
ncbi:phosphatidate cytidylyltransferase [Mariniphaga anaerophila]|uniref:Phosphatidate cytidylyltransferase n=1 Tax=Mariniphaga anaerophila TaxID=1484053 RepID=A0A1M5E1Q7_9BACT|nr:phosphatidate cytidylyltransferase [Mariniphaga anaerophila]SHF73106.1 phosphatidate cytidylyltransferase [Mariniphaga anaerophila]